MPNGNGKKATAVKPRATVSRAILEAVCSTRPAVSVLAAVFSQLSHDVVPRLVVQRVLGPFTLSSSLNAVVPCFVVDLHDRLATSIPDGPTLMHVLRRFGGPPLKDTLGGSDQEHGHERARGGGLTSLHLTGPWPRSVALADYAGNLTSLRLDVRRWDQTNLSHPNFTAGTRNVKHLAIDAVDTYGTISPGDCAAFTDMIPRCDSLTLSGSMAFITCLLTTESNTSSALESSLQRPLRQFALDKDRDHCTACNIDMWCLPAVSLSHLKAFEFRRSGDAGDYHVNTGQTGAATIAATLINTNLGGAALQRLVLKLNANDAHQVPWAMVRRVLLRSPNLRELTLSHFEPAAVGADITDSAVGGGVPVYDMVAVFRALSQLTLLHLPLVGAGVTGLSDAHVAALLLPQQTAEEILSGRCASLEQLLSPAMSDALIQEAVASFFRQRQTRQGMPCGSQKSSDEGTCPSPTHGSLATGREEGQPPPRDARSTDDPFVAGMSPADFNSVPLPRLTSLDLSGHRSLTTGVLTLVKARAAMTPLMRPFLRQADDSDLQNAAPASRRTKRQLGGLRAFKAAKVWSSKTLQDEGKRSTVSALFDVHITT